MVLGQVQRNLKDPQAMISLMASVGRQIKKAYELFFDTQKPWRKWFLLYRIINSASSSMPLRGLDSNLTNRILLLLKQYPDLLFPLHLYWKERNRNIPRRFQADILFETASRNPLWMLNLAKVEYESGRLGTGDRALELAKEHGSHFIEVFEEEALNQRGRGNTFRAVRAASDCIGLSATPRERVFWLAFRAREYYALKNFESALNDFQAAFSLKPDKALAYRIAEIYDRLERFRDAEHYHRKAMPSWRKARLTGPRFFDEVVFLHETKQRWHATVSSHDSLPVHNAQRRADALINALKESGDYERIIQENRDKPLTSEGSLLNLGAAYLALGMWKDAAAVFVKVLDSHPAKKVSREIRYLLGQSYQEAGRYEEAARHFKATHTCRQRHLMSLLQDSIADEEARPRQLKHYWRQLDWSSRRIKLQSILDESADLPKLRRAASLLGDHLTDAGFFEDACVVYRLMLSPPDAARFSEATTRESEKYYKQKYYTQLLAEQPLRGKTILFEAFHGASTSCNPLAISLALLNDSRFSGWLHIWAVKAESAVDPRLVANPNVRFVAHDSFGYLRHLATADVLVNNNTFMPYFVKRLSQFYVNTWHGTPLKTLGKKASNQPFAYGNAARNFLQASLLALPNQRTAESLQESYDVGPFINSKIEILGSPRLDGPLFLATEEKVRLLSQLHLTEAEKWILYAPTWRGSFTAISDPLEEIKRVQSVAQLVGLPLRISPHHLQREMLSSGPMKSLLIPETISTTELLGLRPIVVSDFSSILVDAAILECKTISFAPDRASYEAEQGIELQPDQIGAERADSNHLLQQALERFLADGRPSVSQELSLIAQSEDGFATQRVVEKILNHHRGTPKPSNSGAVSGIKTFKLLFSVSGLIPNGITTSLRSLLAALSGSTDIEIWVALPQSVLENANYTATIEAIQQVANVLPQPQANTSTFAEQDAIRSFQMDPLADWDSSANENMVINAMRREWERQFGTANFDAIVEFNGYSPRRTMLYSFGTRHTAARTIHYLHNDIYKEATTRFAFLHTTLAVLKQYDALVSVSESLADHHRKTLVTFGIPPERHVQVNNSLDADRVRLASGEHLSSDLVPLFRKNATIVAVPARLSPEKNHQELIRAFSQHLQEYPESSLELVFLGGGPEFAALKNEVRSRDLGTRVHIVGHIDNPYPAMRNSNFVFLPSRYEGQGLVLLEALILKTPVWATDIPGPRSVLANGRLGELVSPDSRGLKQALDAMFLSEHDSKKVYFDDNAYARTALHQFYKAIGYEK